MKPVELLQQELDKLISARNHSTKSFEEGKITSDLHNQHMTNLTPIIEDYRFAIEMLKKYT